MKILQVVTVMSATNVFGGPVSVALGQCEQLAQNGHEVTLATGWWGPSRTTAAETAGMTRREFRARRLTPRSFSGTWARGLSRYMRRHAAGYDVVHIHLARDLVTLPAALSVRATGTPYVTQTHGMIVHDGRLSTRLVDRAWTRPVLRGASARLVLSERERADLAEVVPGVPTTLLGNGVASDPRRAKVCSGEPLDILFMARLNPRKCPTTFVELAAALVAGGMRARFSIVGPDEGELPAVRQRIATLGLDSCVTYEGSLAPSLVRARLAQAQILVLPSVDEPFPVTLLEAMSVGLPIVCLESCGIAKDVLSTGAGRVAASGDVGSLAVAVQSLSSPEAWEIASTAALRLVEERFGLRAVVERLEGVYVDVLGARDQG